MKNLILAVLLFPLLLAAQATPQCTDYTVSATGRTLVLTNARVDLVSGQFTYYTAGSPTGVSATVEAGNKAVAVQTPFTKISAVTDTAGADMGTAAGAYRYWWINLGTLSGGTKPTVVFTACFSPTAWSRFAWPATGISGGILGFTSPTTLASSVLLTANALIVGGGAGATPTPLALGTANYLLGMNSGGTANAYRATVASAQGGFGASLAAAGAGLYPKSNGATPAVFAASTLAASGVGTPTACTSQFITGFTLAGDAAPVSTCTSIVAGDLGTTMTPQFARIGVGVAAHATDLATITSTDTTASSKAVNIAHSGAITGTGYGLYASKTGASTTNVGGYFSASGGTNNYGLLTVGNLGFGTILPVGTQQTKFTATTPIIFATGDTLGSYTSVTFPTANKDYANATGICTACAVGDLVIITAGTGAYTGQYTVLTILSANSIQLSRTCHNEAGDIVDGAVSVVGSPALSVGSNRTYFNAKLLNASSNETAFRYDYTVNKVAGNSTGLQINATHTLAPGTNYPFEVNVGGVNKFYVGTTLVASSVDHYFSAAVNFNFATQWAGFIPANLNHLRNTTADTAGHGLTLQTGGATLGATNKAGGNVTLKSGIGTGNAAGSQFIVQTPTPDAAGTADQTLVTRTITDVSGQTINYGNLKFTSQVKPGAPTSNAPTDGGACTDGSHVIATSFVTSNGETEYGAVSAAQTCVLGTTKQTIPMSGIPTGITGVTTGRNMCASKAGTVTPLYQVGASPTIADNSTTTYNFVTADASLTVACNATNTTTGGIWVDGTKFIRIDSVTNSVNIPGYLGSAGLSNTAWMVLGGLILNYNGIPTVANGVPAEYAVYDPAELTAALGATTLYAVPAAGAGRYRVSWVAKIITAATTSSVLGGTNGFQITYTDADDSVAVTPLAVPNAVATGNTTGTQLSGVVIANCKASTNLQIQFDYTSVGATPMGYKLHVIAEKL